MPGLTRHRNSMLRRTEPANGDRAMSERNRGRPHTCARPLHYSVGPPAYCTITGLLIVPSALVSRSV